jgi:V/A-type H+-transporting ATPase subunit K
MDAFWKTYFLDTGVGWAIIGAMTAVFLGGVGSAKGIRIAGAQAGGALSEKPEIFGKLLILMALPGTQGFYAFIVAVVMALRIGLLGKAPVVVTPVQGLALLFVGFAVGIVEWRSAIYQGEASAAAISLVARRPDESGRAILIPALVETYAVLALLAGILFVMWITGMKVAPAA